LQPVLERMDRWPVRVCRVARGPPDTALRDGFHGYEPGEDIRWTNGNAGLPADLFSACSGPLDIEITTAGATQYLEEGAPLAA